MNLPLVSVIIPLYNCSAFVTEAVYSALNQTYANIEVIVVDDGSTDDSYSVVSSIVDERLRVYSQLNQGACVARDRGLKESKGEYVKFLDADDVLYPDAIEVQVEQISELGENEEVFGDFDYIDESGCVYQSNRIDVGEFNSTNQDIWYLSHWHMVTATPLHRRTLLERVCGFDVKLQAHQESTLHFSMSISGVKFVYKPHPIVGYRNYQSDTRISCIRDAGKYSFAQEVYHWEKLLELIRLKYGNEPNKLTNIIGQNYLFMLIKYAIRRSRAEADFCLDRCIELLPVDDSEYYDLTKQKYFRWLLSLSRVFGIPKAYRLLHKYGRLIGVTEIRSIVAS